MKKKIFSILLIAVMVLASVGTAFAQTVEVGAATDPASVTIENPAKGETYKIYKLFDATVSGDKVAYSSTSDIPEALEDFFARDTLGNVTPKDAIKEGEGTKMTDDLKAALATWAASAEPVKTAVSNGETLAFTNLPYGYYVVTTTHKGDDGTTAITVTNAKADVTVVDKNFNRPDITKDVDQRSYSIGETITYTGTATTTNYIAAENETDPEAKKQVVEYTISDTLPEFLTNVRVESITIGGVEYKVGGEVPQFVDKKIVIPWATYNEETKQWTSLYTQGAEIVVVYKAELTSVTNIGADDVNEIKLTCKTGEPGDDTPKPWEEEWTDKEEIITYAAALKKVDENDQPLAGATFDIKGLVLEAVEGEAGVYRVVRVDANHTNSNLATDSTGHLYIIGIKGGTDNGVDADAGPAPVITATENTAPAGYNKVATEFTLKPQVMEKQLYETSGSRKYDSDGNVISETSTATGTTETIVKNLSELDAQAVKVENKKGVEMPETGGMGTTIIYILGAALVIGAGVVLVSRKRSNDR